MSSPCESCGASTPRGEEVEALYAENERLKQLSDASQRLLRDAVIKQDRLLEELRMVTDGLLDFDCVDEGKADEDGHADECWHCTGARIKAEIA